jgi:hypothetical protein
MSLTVAEKALKVAMDKEQKLLLVLGKTFDLVKAKMSEYGQIFGKRYEQVTLLISFDRDSPIFESVEEKKTKAGRPFHVVNFIHPATKEDLSLPISGDNATFRFEIWDCINIDDWKTDDGKLIPKGLPKVRCYSAD